MADAAAVGRLPLVVFRLRGEPWAGWGSNPRATDYEWQLRLTVGSSKPKLGREPRAGSGPFRRFGNQVGNPVATDRVGIIEGLPTIRRGPTYAGRMATGRPQ